MEAELLSRWSANHMNLSEQDTQPLDLSYPKTKLPGAYWSKRSNYWFSRIHKGGKNIHLGIFNTPEEASAAFFAAGGGRQLFEREVMLRRAEALSLTLPDNARAIPLTKGQFAIVDATDYDWLMQWKWQVRWNPCTKSFYAKRGCAQIQMSRQILAAANDVLVDHRDGDTLNNRRGNLRPATSTQNQYNSRLRSDNPSGFRGVTFDSRSGKWLAQIRIGGCRNKKIGRFRSPEEASEAYKKAAQELHGEFYRAQ